MLAKTEMGDFSGYIKTLYTSQGSNGIYYHTSSLANSAGDNSYRYAGSNPNNYVCFGSTASTCPSANLYRIIGVYGDQVKLIHATYATTAEIGTIGHKENNLYYWSGEYGVSINTWNSSKLNTEALNGTFLTNLGTTWTNKIAQTTWYVGGVNRGNGRLASAQTAYNYELGNNRAGETYNAKVGMPYLSEYYYGANPTYWTYPGWDSAENDYRKSAGNNWILANNLFSYHLLSRVGEAENGVAYVSRFGYVAEVAAGYNELYIRPTFNLVSNTKVSSGLGTESDPYRIVI